MPTHLGESRSMRSLATALITLLVGLLLANSAATVLTRVRVAHVQDALDQRWLPAQTATAQLLSTYVDEETGERGFLLTGDPVFLQPYTRGGATAAHLQRVLSALLATDAASTSLLRQTVDAYDAWHQRSAVPQIAARQAGPIPQAQVDAGALEGKVLFDRLRTRMTRLSDRTTRLIRSALHSVSSTQMLADIVAGVTVGLALVAAALALPLTRRVLTRPLGRLLAQLQGVAGGNYQQAIEPSGSAELVAMAESAEQMRQSLLAHSEDLLRAQETLTLQSERYRVAADLHDRTIQRMFGLGLTLSSLSKRHPELNSTLMPLVDETDRGITELRGIIFNLSHDDE
jgi:CHASE3 domain sensor protein